MWFTQRVTLVIKKRKKELSRFNCKISLPNRFQPHTCLSKILLEARHGLDSDRANGLITYVHTHDTPEPTWLKQVKTTMFEFHSRQRVVTRGNAGPMTFVTLQGHTHYSKCPQLL